MKTISCVAYVDHTEENSISHNCTEGWSCSGENLQRVKQFSYLAVLSCLVYNCFLIT